MASSLLFKIQSRFDGSGFNQAKSSFDSTLGVVGQLLTRVGSLVFSFRTLGVVAGSLVPILGLRLTGAILRGVPAAAEAEESLNRLRTQMSLLGIETEANVSRLESFARGVSLSTRFTEESVQAATTVALRQNESLADAIQQVSVAQDIAAATGRDLLTTTRLLNLAQSGRAGILLQITDLSRREIETLSEEGKLLDELATRFGGAAAREADNLSSKVAVLNNISRETFETLGELGLPLVKVFADINTALARVGLAAAETFAFIQDPASEVLDIFRNNQTAVARLAQNFSDAGFAAFSNFLKTTIEDTTKLTDEQQALRKEIESTFDPDRQLELNQLLLGTTDRSERQEIRKEFEETEQAIRRIQDLTEAGVDPTRQAVGELEILQESRFRFARTALRDLAQEVTDRQEQFAEDVREFAIEQRARGLEQSQLSNLGGPTGAALDIVNNVRNALDNNVSVISIFAQDVAGSFNALSADVTALLERLSTPEGVFRSGGTNVNVEVNARDEDVRASVKNAVSEALAGAGLIGLIDRISTDIRRQAREDTANSSIS